MGAHGRRHLETVMRLLPWEIGRCRKGMRSGCKSGADRVDTDLPHLAENVRVVRKRRRECSSRILPGRGKSIILCG